MNDLKFLAPAEQAIAARASTWPITRDDLLAILQSLSAARAENARLVEEVERLRANQAPLRSPEPSPQVTDFSNGGGVFDNDEA